jgi:hypothetical protein
MPVTALVGTLLFSAWLASISHKIKQQARLLDSWPDHESAVLVVCIPMESGATLLFTAYNLSCRLPNSVPYGTTLPLRK